MILFFYFLFIEKGEERWNEIMFSILLAFLLMSNLSSESYFLKTYLTLASIDVFSLYSQPEQHPISS